MITLKDDELSFSFSRSSGAGGQNVNKVNSKATLHWDITKSEIISQAMKERFLQRYGHYVVGESVVITSQKHRSQNLNIKECKDKLLEMLRVVEHPPKKRMKTRPTFSSVKKRLESKKRDSLKKQLRSKKNL